MYSKLAATSAQRSANPKRKMQSTLGFTQDGNIFWLLLERLPKLKMHVGLAFTEDHHYEEAWGD
jgi:hypothetical protein